MFAQELIRSPQKHTASMNNLENNGSPLHDHLTRFSRDDFMNRYEVVAVIGHGSFGTILTVKLKEGKVGGSAFESEQNGFLGLPIGHRKSFTPLSDRPKTSTNYLYALKEMNIDDCSDNFLDSLYTEISILRSLDHPNIIKALEVFETNKNGREKHVCLVLELCTGGDLYSRVPYSQREAALIVSKVVNAIHYIHQHNVIHRDIKFENILFESSDADAEIKIIDFGLSKIIARHKNPVTMNERVGTIYTMAPEVLQRKYSIQADMWSVGVITYMLLTTSKPFYCESVEGMMELILDGTVEYDSRIWNRIDESAKDFVQRLLVVNPNQRMTADDASMHKWIEQRDVHPEERPSNEFLSDIDHCLLQYKNNSILKKIALNVIAHQSTSADTKQLRKVFRQLDKSRDGVLSYHEFKTGLVQVLKYSDEDIDKLFSSIDINRTGQIMYTEFLAATIETQGRIGEDRIAEAFDRIDRDRNGYITKKDLITTLGPHYSKRQVNEILKAADYDHDGKISYEEFLRNFREKTQQMTNRSREVAYDSDAYATTDSEQGYA